MRIIPADTSSRSDLSTESTERWILRRGAAIR
jgi:hypothetical protein